MPHIAPKANPDAKRTNSDAMSAKPAAQPVDPGPQREFSDKSLEPFEVDETPKSLPEKLQTTENVNSRALGRKFRATVDAELPGTSSNADSERDDEEIGTDEKTPDGIVYDGDGRLTQDTSCL